MYYDVIVVGGGLVGLQTAISLSMYDLHIAVIDSQSVEEVTHKKFDGRTCAVAWASANVMKKTDVWSHLKSHVAPMWNVLVEDDNLAKECDVVSMQYTCDLTGGNPLGYVVENIALRKAQYDVLRNRQNIDHHMRCTVTDIIRNKDMAQVHLADGSVLQAKVVLGCDGKKSFVAQNAGIEKIFWQYKQTAIVCTVHCEKPHEGVAVEVFLPHGPFAMLPMTNNRMNIIWTEKTSMAQDLLSMEREDFVFHLKHRFGSWLGKIRVIEDARYGYPLALQHAKTYIAPRTALVGDAAHSMHPIAGQGFNMGVRDIAAIVQCIVLAHRKGQDIGGDSVLKAYEQYRYTDNASLIAICDILMRVFSNNNGLLKAIRRFGLSILDKNLLAKKFFMRHAMGTIGSHIPKLLKYEDI